MHFLCTSVLCLLLLSVCAGRGAGNETAASETAASETAASETAASETAASDLQNEEETAAVVDPIQIRAAAIASSLDDRLLAAQVLICGIDGRGFLPPHMKDLLAECPAGGVILFRYNLDTRNDAIRSLLTDTASFILNESDIPPFISVDHEGGKVHRFLPGVAALPAPYSYWELAAREGNPKALEKIEADSFNAGSIIKSFGINLNFAPVAEYLNADNRDFLQSRSYGPDPFFTAQAAAAFVRGMERGEVLCAIKHFPGSAGADPHHFPSVLKGGKAVLDELVSPFASLVKGGARAVMISHSRIPALDSEIASLSKIIMGGWLRGELGFNGIIICDDFSMTAAGGLAAEDAAVRSVAAGADMILVWPPDIRRTYRAFLAALDDGRLTRERLAEAAERIIYEKIRMGLIDGE